MIKRFLSLPDLNDDERASLLNINLSFICMMITNYLIQPVRDEQLVIYGTRHSSKLLISSCVIAMFLGPITKRIAANKSTVDTGRSIRDLFRVFSFVLLLFYFTLPTLPAVGTVDGDDLKTNTFVSAVFYVYSNIFSLFGVSLLWAFASDIFNSNAVIKYFGYIAACCSVGQFLGSGVSWCMTIAKFSTPAMLVAAAVALEGSGHFIMRITRDEEEKETITLEKSEIVATNKEIQNQNPTSALYGIKLIFGRPYFLAMAVFTLLYTITMALIYVERLSIVANHSRFNPLIEPAEFSARINTIAAILTFIVQATMSSTIVQYGGIHFALLYLPMITACGFACFVLYNQSLFFIAFFEISRRVTAFAVSKPAREALYSVVSRKEKYAVKGMIDTLVYRIGSGLGALIHDYINRIKQSNNDSVFQISCIYLMLILVWIASCFVLIQQYGQRQLKLSLKQKEL